MECHELVTTSIKHGFFRSFCTRYRTEETLIHYRCTKNTLQLARIILRCAYVILSGTIITSSAGWMASQMLKKFGFDDSLAHQAGATLSSTVNMVQNLSPVGIITRTTIGIIGSYAVSLFTF